MSRATETQLRINEIFHSIQGESSRSGLPCVFIRLTYCNLRCSYCDTEYAFFEGEDMTVPEIMAKVAEMKCNLVEITGGEPLIQKNVHLLMSALCDADYDVMIETGGHMDIGPIDERVKIIMDIKCPSSGEHNKNRWQNIDLLKPQDEVKFVIGDINDFKWARSIIKKYKIDDHCFILFSPVFEKMPYQELAELILTHKLPVRMQLQIHKYIWAPETKGV
jgi:7-carboxy-7-deazaguanine synthase